MCGIKLVIIVFDSQISKEKENQIKCIEELIQTRFWGYASANVATWHIKLWSEIVYVSAYKAEPYNVIALNHHLCGAKIPSGMNEYALL